MKTLTKITLLAAGLAAVALPTFAADKDAKAAHRGRPGLRALAKHRTELRARIAHRLDLTDAQKQQLKAKRAETKSALQALRADTSLTKEQKHAKARELIASTRGNLRSVLTPDQQTKLDQMRERLAKHRQHRRAR
jgi:Spy/CpxP family protein refolding chaperone